MITRCPACGTMFNVVPDQLKISQGWVRCGQCSDVFDASLHLQEAGNFESVSAQTNAVPGAVPDAVPGTQTPVLPAVDSSVLPGAVASQLPDSIAEQPLQPPNAAGILPESAFEDDFERSLQEAIDAAALARQEGIEELSSKPAPLVEPPIYPATSEPSRAELNSEIEAEESAAAADSVSFVQAARRQAFWKKRWVRAVLLATVLCLAVALLLQIVVKQRDYLLIGMPQLKPLLQAVCEPLRCELAPLRKIDAVVIDSSTFTKSGADSYRLNFSLKNLGNVPVAMPALEVTLTDTQDQPLVRRVLLPAQFGAGTAQLTSGADFSGSIMLDVSAANTRSSTVAAAPAIAGYRLLAFYP